MKNGYENLKRVLDLAFDQAASGKGADRHAGGRKFEDQPIFKIADLVGVGFQSGQAIKKIQEAVSMMDRGEYAAAEKEFLGAIVYTAACFLTSEKKRVGEINLKRQEYISSAQLIENTDGTDAPLKTAPEKVIGKLFSYAPPGADETSAQAEEIERNWKLPEKNCAHGTRASEYCHQCKPTHAGY